ncbi:MAG: DNA repair protein RecN [Paludibacteraceae bacterium]|nr:DNA repair protein RecN [Paludibacteraceae bacterium]
MLTQLYIKNYALIRQLDIRFESGFSVMTGETGAGKSIILGALALVMGGRADAKAISDGEEKCIIEATFSTEGILPSSETIIRRELSVSGRSRSFVNDEVVTQAELKQLAARLIDIHSQHESLLMGDDSFQLGIVDTIAFGTDRSLPDLYTRQYTAYCDLNERLTRLQAEARRAKQDADYLRFQWQQLDELALQEGETEQLEQEIYRLSHAEEIQTQLQTALYTLTHEENGVLSLLHGLNLNHVSSEISERLQSCKIELGDIADELQRQADLTEMDPERLAAAEERLGTIHTLMRKHQVQTEQELLARYDELSRQCQHLDSYDEDIAALQAQVAASRDELSRVADRLSESRQKVRPIINSALTKQLQQVGIRHPKVDVQISATPDFTPTGKDDVQFLFAANLNQSLRRVSEVASGGEMSRLMLCIKALTASTNGLPTIIFDEIDTGVSGEIATRMGDIMRQIADSRQVIAITHLPQIAAMGDAQYKVYKQDTDRYTETHIRRLNQDERVDEIAAMLSGDNITPAARDNARQLLTLKNNSRQI